ncbi:Rpb7-binding protein seb1 [Schizosaccharomyces pombe]
MSGIAEFDGILDSLEHSKTGISGSKILKLTNLSMENVSENAQFVASVYKYAKRAPVTHKLGALYILDSIVRSFQDGAKKNNESFENPVDASFSGGWCKAAEITDSLVADAIQHAPSAHLPKILKLCDIWEKASTFPPEKLESLRSKLKDAMASTEPVSVDSAAAPSQSTNPEGNGGSVGSQAAAPTSRPVENDAASILEALAAFAQKAPVPSAAEESVSTPPQPAVAPSVSAAVPNLPVHPATAINAQSQSGNPLSNPLFQPSNVPQSIPSGPMGMKTGSVNDTQSQQITLMNVLASQNVPPAQIDSIMKAAFPNYNAPFQPAGVGSVPLPAPTSSQSLRLGSLHRSRSPSPRSGRPRRSPSPSHLSIPSTLPPADGVPKPTPDGFPRRFERDPTIPPDSIKVYSRTLFLGGITRSVREPVLRSMFERFGSVQSLILNHNYRHGFLKMFRRDAAEKAQVAMENVPFADTTIRTKWGVGFGPRECSDFSTGISVIPIRLLTDADRTWLVTAEYGGTGGLPITPGIALDEPDIEIGLGISSKAISKRGKDFAMRRDERFRGRKPYRGGPPIHHGERHFDSGNDWHGNPSTVPPPTNPYNPGYPYMDPNYSSGYVSQPPWQPQ